MQAIAGALLVVLLPLYWAVQGLLESRPYPEAVQGVLDLSGYSLEQEGPVELLGEWEFYRGQLLTPEQFGPGRSAEAEEPRLTGYVGIPGKWNDYISEEPGRHATGYGTFRLRVQLGADSGAVYGVHTNNIRTANKLYLNGQLAGQSGTPGAGPAATAANNIPYTAYAASDGDQVEILVQIANYSYSSGGMIYPILFGTTQDIGNSREWGAFGDLVSAVGFALLGVYFLVLYRLRPGENALLYLGLFCLAGFVYTLTHGEKLIGELLPGLSYEAVLRTQLVATAFVYFSLLHYVAASLPTVVHRRVLMLSKTVTALLLAGPLFLPTLVFAKYEVPILVYSLLVVCYVGYALLKGLRLSAEDTGYLLISVESILVVLLDRILNVFGVLDNRYLAAYEMLIFVIAQSLLLAKRHARSFVEVEDLSRKLLTLDGLKDEFLANTSHELRTPLHGILNIAESMLDGAAGPVTAKQAGNLGMIVSTGRRLTFLIQDLLDFAKLKHGELKLRPQPVDVDAAVYTVLEVIEHTTGGRDLRFVRHIPDDLPAVHMDEDRLRQILYNLLGNAVKFTLRGEIRVTAARTGEMVKLSVADTGIGIAEDRLPGIFQAFDQAGSSVDPSYGGTGLGLSITKKLVELGGGRIWVESRLGEGSVFHFTLPAASGRSEAVSGRAAAMEAAAGLEGAAAGPAADPPPAVEAREPFETAVLIVDDDPVNLQALRGLLASEPCEVIAVHSGAEALEELAANPLVALVITDWMMPGMSGLELSRAIRERFSLSDLPILMLTARSRPEDIQVGFQAGINDFLSKPVDGRELRARVRTLLELQRSVRQAVRTEMAFLQAQIKPHFLYNVLNTLIAICPSDPQATTRLLIELSKYLRGSFDFQNRDQLIPLHKEMELVESFLALEKARFEERLRVEIQVKAPPQLLIPPLTIQPIVENAVRHGIMRRASGGLIRLTVEEKGGGLAVTVADDGVGIEPQRLQELLAGSKSAGGVGLLNIHRRLMTLYGEGLLLESEPGRGTTVRFKVKKESRH
ncbi:hypothetical protein J31TS4_37710 [Paenibacillus sp. J31TS4]|nr:hypothetical protein J31TS4_37710 [Paenibacillus sp. J31TS4]